MILRRSFFVLPSVWALCVGLGSSDARADDATAQCIASSEQGLDLRKQEKLTEARKVLATCATTKCPDEIRSVCEQRITEINGVMPSIVFEVTDASGIDQTNVKLSIDGVGVSSQLGGRSTPVDPGPHVFTLEVAGQPPIERKLVVGEGERERHEKVVIGAPSSVAPVPASSPADSTAVESAASNGRTQKTLGLVAGGVGVAGVALGAVFGWVASSKWSTAKSDCGAVCGPASTAQQEKSDAESAATVATIGFVGGGVLLAAGAILFFTAPSVAKPRTAGALRIEPAVGPGKAALSLQGEF